MIRISSFDIFDTCLTRTVAYPIDLFVEVGEISLKNGWIAVTPQEFAAHRVAAEQLARLQAPSREITLAHIYQQLGLTLKLAPQVVAEIQNTELLVEEKSLRPILETRSRIARAREEGRQILFLSDMYLPATFLVDLLKKHEFYQEGDNLYVSGEVGRNKGDGGLFLHARDQLKTEVTDWAHFGDNAHADVKAPRRIGLAAEHFAAGLLNRYELLICPGTEIKSRLKSRLLAVTRWDQAKKPLSATRNLSRERWRSRLAAAMRLARLTQPPGLTPHEKVVWDTGANLAGPLFYGYVKWLLDQAGDRNLSRLYFVARDGQILMKIAERIKSVQKNSIECRYLHGSRHAWIPASLRELDTSHLRWILAPTPGLCVQDVFARLEINPEKQRSLLESSGFPANTWHQPLSSTQVARLAEVFRDEALSAKIKSESTTKREELLHYLRTAGLFKETKIGMVDLGWRGSLREALVQVCDMAPDPIKPRIDGFYFALVGAGHRTGEGYLGYVNSLRPDLLGGLLFSMQLLEAFAAADHGQTIGYRHGQPILARTDNPTVSDWGLPSLQGGILAFCQAYGDLDDSAYPVGDYPEATLSALQLFYENPTRAEIEAWGAFPFSDQQVEGKLSGLLPEWNRTETMKALLTSEGRKRLWWAPALAKREKMISLHLYYRLQKLWKTQLKPGVK
jgi:FMN phosphatase YigB (HAD superfamily)